MRRPVVGPPRLRNPGGVYTRRKDAIPSPFCVESSALFPKQLPLFRLRPEPCGCGVSFAYQGNASAVASRPVLHPSVDAGPTSPCGDLGARLGMTTYYRA